ncbi:MAG: alpha/beta hydrolase [Fimbriimonadaceae bacterium]
MLSGIALITILGKASLSPVRHPSFNSHFQGRFGCQSLNSNAIGKRTGGEYDPQEAGSTARWMTPKVNAVRVTYCSFKSKAAKTEVSFHVYLPKAYDVNSTRRFPVIYWLHGSGGGLPGISPVSSFFDQAMEAKKMQPAIIVFPNSMASGMWCDSKDGKTPIETIVIKELLPEVDAKFRTISKRGGRIIEGFSMGGYGAGRLGFKYPELFAGVSMLAGGPLDLEFQGPRAASNPAERARILQSVYGGDLEVFKAQSPWMIAATNRAKLTSGIAIRICIGEGDFTLSGNRAFSEHLKDLEIPHQFVTKPDVDHDTIKLLTTLGEDNWKFYRENFAPEESLK